MTLMYCHNETDVSII